MPLGIGEFGVYSNQPAAKNAAWIRSFIPWAQQTHPIYLCYFNSYVGGNFWLEDQPDALQAFRDVYNKLK